jgi:hypothetical protein
LAQNQNPNKSTAVGNHTSAMPNGLNTYDADQRIARILALALTTFQTCIVLGGWLVASTTPASEYAWYIALAIVYGLPTGLAASIFVIGPSPLRIRSRVLWRVVAGIHSVAVLTYLLMTGAAWLTK